MFGHHIQHPHSGAWARRAPKKNRAFNPNIQKTKMMVNGATRSVNACTRCLRTLQKTS